MVVISVKCRLCGLCGNQVRTGIDAPRSVGVHRDVYQQMPDENAAAVESGAAARDLPAGRRRTPQS